MRVAVIGSGYVGLVAGAGFAETGNDVICADIDAGKIAGLGRGEIPIFEPGLDELVTRNLKDERLRFSTDVAWAVRESEVIFIAVGTPEGEDGSADLQHVLAVADIIGQSMNGEKVVITKSTVPVGTAEKVRAAIAAQTSHRVHICSNPEFLKEGAAVDDFMKPDRVVVGVESEHAKEVLSELYAPFVRTGKPILFMDVPSAEITKYAANAMLATRISFMNMIARLCDAVGADVALVRQGIGSDERIGSSFLFAGAGYGGSCFPKDVKALRRTMRELDLDPGILDAVDTVNERQKRLLAERVRDYFADRLEGRSFAIWGLSFKPDTDDLREAPALVLIDALLGAGASVRAHDPEAIGNAERHYGARHGDRLRFHEHNYDALEGADALVIVTEWRQYRVPDFARMKALLREPVIFDGRNLFDPARMESLGFDYISVGRPPVRRAGGPAGS
ncbi:MAG TPA: UDP-glucose/GDP-mannose dehydrogenase family protein [Longimicrobiales bacterium]|nr:UDP-glucose/GDP-mannose dehydrogenase family protein [Longimicrobiales bacterium]